MHLGRASRTLLPILTIAAMAFVPVGASAQTQTDVDAAARDKALAEARQSEAYQEYQRVSSQLDDAVQRYELLHSQHEELIYRIFRMESAVDRYQTEADRLEADAKTLLIDAYTSGQQNMIGSAFAASSIEELVTSRALLDRATEIELAALDNLDAVSRQADRSAAELDIRRTEVASNEDDASIVVDEIAALQTRQRDILAQADDTLRAAIETLNVEIREKKIEDDRLAKEKAEREAAAKRAAESSSQGSSSSTASSSSASGSSGGASSSTTSGFICPVQGGASFIDSWGYPRSGGRRHKGVDMFNARNTPLVAVVNGTVKLSSNSLGGLSAHLYASNGVVYYYAHLQSHAGNISSGQSVSKGTVIGFLGNSGNARYTSPHLHFEIRPNGKAVNPYPTVRAVC
jgi:murein DD-endopeptidase MepM/ murein hydrolase activator NlpD